MREGVEDGRDQHDSVRPSGYATLQQMDTQIFPTRCYQLKYISQTRHSLLLHRHHTANAVARLHLFERLVDILEALAVSDEFVDLQLATEVVLHQVRELRTALDTTKGASLPLATGDELESCTEC